MAGLRIVIIGVLCYAMQVVMASDEKSWFPFVISYDGADNASSVAHLLDAPAGKHGFVRVKGSDFITDKGQIRFNGTNLTGPANFPEHDVADRLAARLARLGINCVRLHSMDAWYSYHYATPQQCLLDDETHTRRKISETQLEKLDYLVAALKKVGIYVNINLHVARTLDERDGCPKGPWGNKTVGLFMPRMIELQKEYAYNLLTHVNKYTGNAYTDEPAVAMIEITNENTGLIVLRTRNKLQELGKVFLDELEKQWNDWLRRKFPNDKRFDVKMISILNRDPKLPKDVNEIFYRFLWETELAYYTGMYDYIRNTLKAKMPVSGSQSSSFSPRKMQSQLDYVDSHGYFHHPEGKGNPWLQLYKGVTNSWTAGGESIVHTMRLLKWQKDRASNPKKPFTISEYNHPYPSPFVGEAQPIACAYGQLMGWDGIFQYSYNHFPENFEPDAMPNCIFDMVVNTAALAHMPVSAALMIRGDLKVEPSGNSKEFVWNKDRKGKEYVAVDTANSKLFVGYADGRTIPLGNVSLKVGSTETGWATVSLVSRYASGFGESGKSSILIAASGSVRNTDAKIVPVSTNKVAMLEWGKAPVLVEGVSCDITIPASPKRVKCYALAPDGSRMREVGYFNDVMDYTVLKLRTTDKTVWYEVEISE